MTVAELIIALQGMKQDMPVAYALYSEYAPMLAKDISVMKLAPARDDGWIARPRPGGKTVEYLVFPGN